MIRALIYAAVSTEEQADPNMPSLDEQIREGRGCSARPRWRP